MQEQDKLTGKKVNFKLRLAYLLINQYRKMKKILERKRQNQQQI